MHKKKATNISSFDLETSGGDSFMTSPKIEGLSTIPQQNIECLLSESVATVPSNSNCCETIHYPERVTLQGTTIDPSRRNPWYCMGGIARMVADILFQNKGDFLLDLEELPINIRDYTGASGVYVFRLTKEGVTTDMLYGGRNRREKEALSKPQLLSSDTDFCRILADYLESLYYHCRDSKSDELPLPIFFNSEHGACCSTYVFPCYDYSRSCFDGVAVLAAKDIGCFRQDVYQAFQVEPGCSPYSVLQTGIWKKVQCSVSESGGCRERELLVLPGNGEIVERTRNGWQHFSPLKDMKEARERWTAKMEDYYQRWDRYQDYRKELSVYSKSWKKYSLIHRGPRRVPEPQMNEDWPNLKNLSPDRKKVADSDSWSNVLFDKVRLLFSKKAR